MKHFRTFPLWKNDGQPSMKLKDFNRSAVDNLQELIDKGELCLVKNHCLCGNKDEEKDIVVGEKDRFGFPIPQLICSRCGLIRSGLVFDEESNNKFYQHYYRGIYSTPMSLDIYFRQQKERGSEIVKLIEETININEITNVAEIGCGAGGLLTPFRDKGLKTVGYDFDEEYLQYGRSNGLNLVWGDFHKLAEGMHFDLIILSHVFEHFLNPLNELRRILDKVKTGGYLYILVPGIYGIAHDYDPLNYFQNAHVYGFYRQFLQVLFESFGLKVLHGDERCSFICQKMHEEIPEVHHVFDDTLSAYPLKNAKYLLQWENDYLKTMKQSRTHIIKKKLSSIAHKIGIRRKCSPTTSAQTENPTTNTINLNIGSGDWECPNWICCDYPSIWYANAQKGHKIIPYNIRNDDIPFADSSVSNIYCSHVVEHIENEFIQKLFNECYRVLGKGGVLRICCPDAEFLYKVSLFENDFWNWRHTWFDSDFYVGSTRPRQVDFLVREIATPKLLGYKNSINADDYMDVFQTLDMNSFFDYLTKDLSFNEKQVGDHINWWTFEKMESFLKQAGFNIVIHSKYKASVSSYMHDMSKFDMVHPEMTLYVEGIKTQK